MNHIHYAHNKRTMENTESTRQMITEMRRRFKDILETANSIPGQQISMSRLRLRDPQDGNHQDTIAFRTMAHTFLMPSSPKDGFSQEIYLCFVDAYTLLELFVVRMTLRSPNTFREEAAGALLTIIQNLATATPSLVPPPLQLSNDGHITETCLFVVNLVAHIEFKRRRHFRWRKVVPAGLDNEELKEKLSWRVIRCLMEPYVRSPFVTSVFDA